MVDSPIRTAALAALDLQRQAEAAATRDALISRARATLAALPPGDLAGPPATASDVEDVDCTHGLVVLSDGSVALGVYVTGGVHLVRGEADGTWTDLGGPFATLAELGAALTEER